MLWYLAQRLAATVPTLLLVYTIVFFIAHATPGSPWDVGTNRPVDPHTLAALNAKYHLNEPILQQYFGYLGGVLHGDFGPSYRDPTMSVGDIIRDFLPVSLQLGGAGMALGVIVGLILGTVAALSRGTWLDSGIRVITTVGISMPSYVVTSLLIVVLGVNLGWVPTIGWNGLFSPSSIVPVVALALAPMAAVTRYFRASMLEVMHLDFIRTARAKGLPWRIVVIRHMGRNALIPAITVIGVYTSYVLVGSFFVESIAGIPGFGRYFVLSVNARDYPVIIATALVYSLFVIAANLLVDLGYFALDPRVRPE